MRKWSIFTWFLVGIFLLVGCEGDMISSPNADEVSGSKTVAAVVNSVSDEGVEPTVIEEPVGDISARCEARSALPSGVFTPPGPEENSWSEDGFDVAVTEDNLRLSWDAVGSNLMRTMFVYTNQTDPKSTNVYEYDGTVTSDASLSAPEEEEIVHFAFCYNEPQLGGEGCTPGYWRQEHHFDSWPAAFDPDATTFKDEFDRTITIKAKKGRGKPVSIEDPLLGESVRAIGGGVNALARAGTAALLNAASSDVAYAFTVEQVKTKVQGAIDNGTEKDVAETLDEANNAVCPLN